MTTTTSYRDGRDHTTSLPASMSVVQNYIAGTTDMTGDARRLRRAHPRDQSDQSNQTVQNWLVENHLDHGEFENMIRPPRAQSWACPECVRDARRRGDPRRRVVLVVEHDGERVRVHCQDHARLVLDAPRELIQPKHACCCRGDRA